MGNYINVGYDGFRYARNSEYVDKSGLIAVVNNTLNTEKMFSCVTRCRRFGKSLAAKMLCAFYDHSCDSRSLFEDLEIAKHPSFEQHLNKYPVIYLDMSDFVTKYHDDDIVKTIDRKVRDDILHAYPMISCDDDDNVMDCLLKILASEKQKFIFIIDEWDAVCREFESNKNVMDKYVDWLRNLFKSGQAVRVFAGVYMTGILPIKRYKTESALNNFREYSMLIPRKLDRYFGFTKDEVRMLAQKHGADFDELEKWYDGYQIGNELSMFNPNSVMEALDSGLCQSYWAATGAYAAVEDFIQMNFKGLKDDILWMMSGGRCYVDPSGFQNDLSIVCTKDDVLTVLIHLGYLAYDPRSSECYIPNREVAGEMRHAIGGTDWKPVVDALQSSRQLLLDTLDQKPDEVAQAIDVAHDDNTSILSYNDENSLACVLSIAYFFARNDYVVHREPASGKGFADLVFLPRKNVDKPALVVELKCGKSAEEAIGQVKSRDYIAKVQQHTDNILLVGINYDRDTKSHSCIIEQLKNR